LYLIRKDQSPPRPMLLFYYSKVQLLIKNVSSLLPTA
jgi:hypothetical protein